MVLRATATPMDTPSPPPPAATAAEAAAMVAEMSDVLVASKVIAPFVAFSALSVLPTA